MFSLVLVSLAFTVAFLFPVTRYGVGAIVGTVAAMSIVADPLALACIVIGVAVLALSGPSTAPDAPGYLQRAPVDAAKTVRIRFLPPKWDDVREAIASGDAAAMATAVAAYRQSDRQHELIRLRARLDRAIASRHRTRADGIRAQIEVLTASA